MSILKDLSFNRLSPKSTLKPFNCDNPDLTDFFHEDALKHGEQLLTVTYSFETDNETVAYFSVLNDKISAKDIGKNRLPGKINKSIPSDKHKPSYPAVKVGRLAVNLNYEKQGVGSDILSFVKQSFTTFNKTGCRFITVDAANKPNVIKFYKNNSFDFLTKKDEEDRTRLMYYDLVNFKPPE